MSLQTFFDFFFRQFDTTETIEYETAQEAFWKFERDYDLAGSSNTTTAQVPSIVKGGEAAKTAFGIAEIRLALLEACDITIFQTLVQLPEFAEIAIEERLWRKTRHQPFTINDYAFIVFMEHMEYRQLEDWNNLCAGPLYAGLPFAGERSMSME